MPFAQAAGTEMPLEPWDNPDLDDYEFLQGRMETAGDWADSDAAWFRALSDEEPTRPHEWRPQRRYSLPELSQPNAAVKRFRIREAFKGDEYTRSEKGWALAGTPFTFVPIVGRLDNQLASRLTAEDTITDDPADLVVRAWLGQALRHSERVADLTARAIRAVVRPPDPAQGGSVVAPEWRAEAIGAAAMLSSALRDLGDSERALIDTEPFANEAYAPLMTTRAAALCDVGDWEDGRRLAREAQALDDSEEVRRLLDRIERHLAPPSAARHR